MYLFLKGNSFRTLFLLFIAFSIILIAFSIYFPHEAFAMAPPHNIIEDYYGSKEYIGPDPYGHFHKSTTTSITSNTKLTSTYNTRYNYSHNPDYFISDRAVESKPIHELDGKPVYKSVNTYDRNELHFWTPGQCVTDSNPVIYHFEPRHTTFELDADHYEGTISTDVDSVTWARRTQDYMEIIRDYSIYVDNISNHKSSILSKISLCVKTVNNNIVCLYLKCNEIGKRKILWTIWERNRGKYDSYKQFKWSWDSRLGIFSNIKEDIRDDIRAEVEDLLGIRRIRKDLRKSVRAEVEKLLRATRPFGK